MGVRIINGIGFSDRTGAVYYGASGSKDKGAQPSTDIAKPIQDTTTNTTGSRKYIPWGDDNQEPIRMADRIGRCGVLTGIIDDQSRFALGEGVLWAYVSRDDKGKQEIIKFANIDVIDDFMTDNNHYYQEFGLMRDQIGFRQALVRIMLSKDRTKIAAFKRHDIAEMRYEEMQKTGDRKGKSEFIYLCAEWDKVSSEDDERVYKIRLLDEDNPLAHLRDLVDKTEEVEFAMAFKGHSWLKKYYAKPKWQSADKWLDQAIAIPEMKSAMFRHNFRPRYKVVIYERFWDNHFEANEETGDKDWDNYSDEEKAKAKQKVYDKIDQHLTGIENHGKAMFIDGWVDPTTGKQYHEIEIIAIDDKIKDGDMLPDSANANSEMAFSMSYNPSINGTNLPTGPYASATGGSNIREAVAVQIILLEYERQNIRRMYMLFSRFNEWDKLEKPEGSRLEPVIPATILTTLDTGAGTKPVMLGAQPKTPKENVPDNNNH